MLVSSIGAVPNIRHWALVVPGKGEAGDGLDAWAHFVEGVGGDVVFDAMRGLKRRLEVIC